MSGSQSWVYQGRQEHGHFGHGTSLPSALGDAAMGLNDLFHPANAGQRVESAAHSLIMYVPKNDRGRWSSAASAQAQHDLKTAVAAWYGARALTRDAFRAQFLNPYTSAATVDHLRRAARGMVEARSHDELAEAIGDLAAAALEVGVDNWPRFIGRSKALAVEAVSRGDVPGVTKVNAVDATAGLVAALGLLAIVIGRALPSPSPNHLKPAAPILPTIVESVPVPPRKNGETPTDILKPEGRLVGQAGSKAAIRVLPGGEEAAEEMFDRLSQGGLDSTPPGYPGLEVRLPNGDKVGYRPKSTSGPPTIDIKVAGVGITKMKFP